MKMLLVFIFIAAELAVLLKILSGYSRRQLNHFFDGSWGVGRLALVLAAIFLPFFLFAMSLFSPGSLGILLTNPWFYLVLFIVSIFFSIVALGDSLRVFGHRLGGPVRWFEGWKGLLRLYLLFCAIILPVVWLGLFFNGSGDLAQKKATADGTFLGNLKILLLIALALTGYARRHLAVYDAVSEISSQVTAAVASSLNKTSRN